MAPEIQGRADAVVTRLILLYHPDDFPVENIGGSESVSETPEIDSIEEKLAHWEDSYGGQDAFECLVRTILSQNTSDKASQPAHDALMERYGDRSDEDHDLAAALAAASHDELAGTIQPAGLYNQKAETLIRLAERVREEYDSAEGFHEFVTGEDPETVREALLDMKGVGPKTADCVLLFSGGRDGVFPVDTHVHRIYRRLGIAPSDADHETVREVLEAAVPPEKCGFGHTASIQFGREYCSARQPACLDDPEACPLADLCDQVGVYPETGEVVDPSEAPEVSAD